MVSSAPMRPRFTKPQSNQKRTDWGAVNYDFSGVNWDTVSYDLSNVDWKTVFPAAAASTPAPAVVAPAPAAQPEAVVINGNKVQAVPNTPTPAPANVVTIKSTTTAFVNAQTPVAAGNVVTIKSTTIAYVNAPTPVAAGNVVTIKSTTTALVQAAETPAVVATSSSGKRGLGWDPTSLVASAYKFANSGVSWYFNWQPTPTPGMPSNWEFYANIWGSGGIETLADRLQGKPKLIGFNEPDSASQANLGVDAAIALYRQYLVPLKGAGKISQLGTPAVTNSWSAGQGLSWLSGFVNGCSGCGLDFAVVHWYAESLDDFKSHVTQAHQITGLPINVAEFAYTSWNSANEPSEAEVMSFMTQAIAWLDAQDFVIAYAWFGSMYVSEAKYPSLGAANSLITSDLSSLTALGLAY